MNESTSSKRREWVKNAAIIFLAVMLVLTFFSNTIMNYSLPEVATQYVQRGTITAKIRGTGNVEANDPYNVMVKESRVISSVAVKQGDVVEKDQVLYYLEDTESDELKQAEEELENLELAYMKGLFGGTVSPEVISKVASGNTDSFATYQAKVTDMQNRLQAAEDRVNECQEALEALSLQSAINTNNSSISTISSENEKAQLNKELSNMQLSEANAKEVFSNWKNERVAELTNEINQLKKEIEDLGLLISEGESSATQGTTESANDSITVNPGNGPEVTVNVYSDSLASSTLTEGISDYIAAKNSAMEEQNGVLDKIYKAALQNDPPYTGNKDIAALKVWINDPDNPDRYNNYKSLLQDYESLQAKIEWLTESIDNKNSLMSGYEANVKAMAAKQEELQEKEALLNEVNALAYSTNEDITELQKKINQIDKDITDITNANKQSSAEYSNKIANAEAALKNAQAVYDLLKTEQAELAADINAELDLSKTSKDIAEKKEEIEKIKEKSMGAAITAPVAGTVTSLAYVAGETTKPEQAAAVIQAEGKGFTLSFTVTNEQAKKVQVGDVAELQNAWYYDDAQAILSAIKTDPESGGQKKMLVFDVTGSSIQAGQALNLSVGQRSAEYELVVPNSAIREDSNGKFILIVESKSGPISNRYIATRVDVEVLASDDSNSAISAGLYGYEYVITTSTKPVEAGKQVRLSEG